MTPRRAALLLLTLALFVTAAHGGDSSSYSSKAREMIDRGEYEQALDELKAAVSLFPYDLALRKSLATAYAQVGQRELKSSRYEQAAAHFALARELAPDAKDLGLMRGIALYYAKNYDASRTELQAAGENPEPLLYLGKISYDTGDLNGAIAIWRRVKELDPANKKVAPLMDKAERELPVESKMDKGFSSMFDLSFDAELPPGLSAEVLDALERAYSSVGADLGVFPTTRIPVLLYTKSDYSSVTGGPDWSGGLYDGKIRLPVGSATKLTPQMRGIIFHEFTHVLVAELTHGNVPTWFNEGLAQIEEWKEFAPRHTPVLGAGKAVMPLSTLSGSFTSMAGGEAAVAYQQSYSMTQFMVSRYGWYAVQQVLKHLGERVPMEKAVAQALSDWSLDLPGVMRQWRESLPPAVGKTGD
ncbi:MAG TPA: hypothetical protein DCZ75_14770 [Geobacter sp.]|nr:hypothetical protein [Geobacter sp.]